MAHHSDQPLPEDFLPDDADPDDTGGLEEAIENLKERVRGDTYDADEAEEAGPNFGATRRQPEGKLTEEDEGEIRFGVAEKDGKVVLDFGKKVHWIAATPEQAKALAESLLNKAREAKRKR
jgi:hypothetical protein